MFPSWSTLLMSIMLAMCEFAIGIFLLLAIRRKLISKIALLLMSVMTLITPVSYTHLHLPGFTMPIPPELVKAPVPEMVIDG